MATPKKNSSSFSCGSDEFYSIVCLPCHRDEATFPAFGYCLDCQEHLCHNCFQHHKKATPCRHHKLQGKDAMPTSQRLTDSVVHSGTTDNLTTPCPRHKNEMMKLYCHDHEMLLCSICVALEHTKGCHVDYIPEVSGNMINSRDYNHTMDRIDKLLKKCITIKKETPTDAKKCKDSLKKTLEDLKKYRQEINKRIDELQKEIEAKIQVLQHQNDEQIKSVETISEDISKTVKMTYDNMKQLNTSKQADQLFIEVKRIQNQLQDYERSIISLSTDYCMDEYKFIQSQAINDVLQKEKMLGDISTKQGTRAGASSQFNLLPPSADQNITPKCPGEIRVKSSKDKCRCWITGMIVLPPDRLVLADCGNNSIKLVDVNSKSIISHLSLATDMLDAPWNITTITSTQVAVTLAWSHCIQFISVSDKLSKAHAIQTDGDCVGICCHQDKLVVTYREPEKLEILDMKGRVITRVDKDSTGKAVFDLPRYVQANSSSIYVSDEGLHEVITLNWSGGITGRIADIGCPTALALLGDGSLLVCDHKGNKVYQVSDCTASRIVLQDVRHPYAVCVDDRRHKLYISRATDEDKLDNNVLVYNI